MISSLRSFVAYLLRPMKKLLRWECPFSDKFFLKNKMKNIKINDNHTCILIYKFVYLHNERNKEHLIFKT
ncbi:DUF2748 family protein [Mucilaginibacter arboris]|uniref:DUF2748 family protein n=1 Tax=Mucilaginibacter arboris TaxID=2682090 RepID=UPI00374275CB